MNWFRRMMIGRYGGMDLLNGFLFGVMIVAIIVKTLMGFVLRTGAMAPVGVLSYGISGIVYIVFHMLQMASVILFVFRAMSRNIARRQAENQWFIRHWNMIKDKFNFYKKRADERKTGHTLYKCPQCKKSIRVPRGRGRIEITCPACRYRFIKRT